MDISEVAMSVVRERLATTSHVSFVVNDVRTWRPSRMYEVWHDRAVFHFMTSDTDIDAYVTVVAQAVRAGGLAIIGTFAEDGPTQCSGLNVNRYSSAQLADQFAEFFELEATEPEAHITPWGATQHFTWVILRRNSSRICP